jgi:3-oxoacyl-(acyl-carrier-protein) synthase
MMVVEPWQRALDRGARIYAEIAGAASTHDAWHPEDPAPDCRQLARAMREAISRAGCSADDIDVVFADGAGDPRLDRLEADALLAVFGDRKGPGTVPKTMTGRLCSGGAALDLAWAALSIHQGVLPPTVNVPADTVGHGLDLVTEARPADVRHALVVARGVGGFNSAAVLRRPDPETDR